MIQIHSNSPITAQVQNVYLNLTTNQNDVFWYDDTNIAPSYSYMVTRWIPELSLHKVVEYGKLSGFLRNDGKYDYRFNFDRFIRIDKIDFSNIVKVNNYFSYINGSNTSRVSLLINTGNILSVNASLITLNTNGEYYLNSGIDPDDLVASRFEYFFRDRETPTSYFYNNELIPNTIFPITVFGETLHTTLYYGSTSTSNSMSVDPGYDFKIGLYSIPSNVVKMEVVYNASNLPTLYPINNCVNEYFYFNTNGGFDVLRTTGKRNNVEETEKDNIKLNDKIIVMKSKTRKQIIQNTGLYCSEDNIYQILKAPIVYTLTQNDIVAKEYVVETNTFEGYAAGKVAERNFELVFSDPKTYKRIQQKQITFFD